MKALPILPLLALLAACGSHDSGLTPQASVDTLPGGIVSTTSNRPLNPGEWSLVHERDVAPPAGAPGEMFDPQDLALADDGTLYVVDAKPPVIKVYRPDGSYERNIGRQGSGPGEFTVGYIALRGDALVLQDPRQSRATIYDAATGKPRKTVPTGCCFYAQPGIDARDRAWIPLLPRPDSTGILTQWFLRVSVVTGKVDTVATPEPPAASDVFRWNVTNESGEGYALSVPVPMIPRFMQTVDPAGGLVSGYAASYRIRRSADGRDTVSFFGRVYSPEPVTATEKKLLAESKIKEILAFGAPVNESMLRKAFDPTMIPDVQPAFVRLMVFRTGKALVARRSGDTLQARFDLYGADNRWLDSLEVIEPAFATNSFATAALSAGHLAVVGENSTGLPVIRIYRLAKRE